MNQNNYIKKLFEEKKTNLVSSMKIELFLENIEKISINQLEKLTR